MLSPSADPGIPSAFLEMETVRAELLLEALSKLPCGSVPVSGATQSMAPLLAGGETLHWRRMERPPFFGELILFLGKSGLVVHRVLGRKGASGPFRTKGDGRPGEDVDEVSKNHILGNIEAIEWPGARRSLTRSGARFFARSAAAWSSAGNQLHRLAGCLDRGARRLSSRPDPPWWFRRGAWWVQKGGQILLHRLLFRICHPAAKGGLGA